MIAAFEILRGYTFSALFATSQSQAHQDVVCLCCFGLNAI